MKLIFSRKGFDSANGGRPSPIVGGCPVSLPIPERLEASSTYGELGLGQLVEQVTRSKLSADDGCHDDPMFAQGFCWFGQSGAAQGHLRNQGVGIGDVFLFFGLFADEIGGERHHRIYALMDVAGVAPAELVRSTSGWREPPRPHPHLSSKPRRQNTMYFGEAAVARRASDRLRLTRPRGPTSRWSIPDWLPTTDLSRHGNPDRWKTPGELATVAIGQEFV
ncbi:MAG: hypothetical protein ACREBO_10395, partial [Novosphingobium sp.]